MRKKRTLQASIFHCYSDHQIGRELRAMSDLLDLHRDLIDSVHADTVHVDTRQTGCRGMSGESILRCALLKQYRQLSYEELAFHLLDSSSFNCFARLDPLWVPKKSALQWAISSISPTTWEQINQRFITEALTLKIENGQVIRIDSTVTDSPIHAPTDSSLLSDSVRVMVRLLQRADELLGAGKGLWRNHSRVVQKTRPPDSVWAWGRETPAVVLRYAAVYHRDGEFPGTSIGGFKTRWSGSDRPDRLAGRGGALPTVDRPGHRSNAPPGDRR